MSKLVQKANNMIIRINEAMGDFAKLDQGANFQAAKRARRVVLKIEKENIPDIKEGIKEKRKARKYSKKNK